ncbi:alpha/beta fold hydrolase [Poseidonocella sp. HB161398]|uniref:alpha/beta fold hydrolase n=1 Tax=Poseidonocella sp. HB161398 TaxID=2320855 RepID=UPI00110839EC|nr:alpha/beta hydrolase [Poseidonocella sp. HB161398]
MKLQPREQHCARVSGQGGRTIVLAHGFGCDQTVWKDVAPDLAAEYTVVTFDFAGAGGADPGLYDRRRHASLDGYADDVIALFEDMDLQGAEFVGHSVSAMIGAIAALKRPGIFSSLVMIGPSACYLNTSDGYHGGFEMREVEEFLDLLDRNFAGFAATFAPIATGPANGPEVAEEFARTLCLNDAEIASAFARVTFMSDTRKLLPALRLPVHVLACSEDPIAPVPAIEFVHEAIPHCSMETLEATGHCPHITHPAEVVAALRRALDERLGGQAANAAGG